MGQMSEVHNGSAAVDFHLAMALGNGLGKVVRSASEVLGPFQGPRVSQVVVVPLLVGLMPDTWSAPWSRIWRTPDFLYPIASMVTMQSRRHSKRSRRGTTVPALDVPAHSRPSRARRQEWDPCTNLSSKGTPDVGQRARAPDPGREAASNQVASSRAKTRSSVSCEGFPFGSFRKVRSQVSLNREESDGHEAVGTTDDGWHRQHEDVRYRLYCFVRSTRGSSSWG